MARDFVIKKLISPDVLFHRFADFFRGFFLVCFALLAILGLTGTAYFSALVVVSDAPTIPAHTANTGFNAPQITEFEQFSDRLLQGQILWPQVVIPVDLAKVDLTDKERKAVQSGSALLESLLASRGVAKDENRREKVARLIEHTHQRLSLQPGIPDLSFATLFFDHVMEASLKPAFFPTKAVAAGQARERVDRFLIEYPLLHVQWFAERGIPAERLPARSSASEPFEMAFAIRSLGTEFCLALVMAARNLAFASGSGPPSLTET